MIGQKVRYWITPHEYLVGWKVADHGDNVIDVSGWETRDGQGPTFSATKVSQWDPAADASERPTRWSPTSA